MQETQVQSLGLEDLLEMELATHSSQYSCLDRGAWQATVHGAAKSQTLMLTCSIKGSSYKFQRWPLQTLVDWKTRVRTPGSFVFWFYFIRIRVEI